MTNQVNANMHFEDSDIAPKVRILHQLWHDRYRNWGANISGTSVVSSDGTSDLTVLQWHNRYYMPNQHQQGGILHALVNDATAYASLKKNILVGKAVLHKQLS